MLQSKWQPSCLLSGYGTEIWSFNAQNWNPMPPSPARPALLPTPHPHPNPASQILQADGETRVRKHERETGREVNTEEKIKELFIKEDSQCARIFKLKMEN